MQLKKRKNVYNFLLIKLNDHSLFLETISSLYRLNGLKLFLANNEEPMKNKHPKFANSKNSNR
jgi:hypothetical protein